MRNISYLLQHGFTALNSAIASGQFTHPQGLYYGGCAPSYANHMLNTCIKAHHNHVQKAVLIDLHTGLGTCGEMSILVAGNSHGTQQRARCWWCKAVLDRQAIHAIEPHGTLASAFYRFFNTQTEVTATTVEFGIQRPISTFFSTWRENALHHHHSHNKKLLSQARLALKNTFYPATSDWKNSVCKHGIQCIENALRGLS